VGQIWRPRVTERCAQPRIESCCPWRARTHTHTHTHNPSQLYQTPNPPSAVNVFFFCVCDRTADSSAFGGFHCVREDCAFNMIPMLRLYSLVFMWLALSHFIPEKIPHLHLEGHGCCCCLGIPSVCPLNACLFSVWLEKKTLQRILTDRLL